MPTATLQEPRLGAVESVRLQLEEEILSGALRPGSRVNADDVARRMGTSHIPVREALRALDAEGWVVHRPHAGASVCTRELAELIDLFEARALVEPQVLGLAAERRTVHDLETLAAILERQRATHDPSGLSRLNYDFHVALAEASHNSALLATVTAMSKRVRFYYLPTAAARREQSLADHRALRDLLERRDADAATALAYHHIVATRADACAALAEERPSLP